MSDPTYSPSLVADPLAEMRSEMRELSAVISDLRVEMAELRTKLERPLPCVSHGLVISELKDAVLDLKNRTKVLEESAARHARLRHAVLVAMIPAAIGGAIWFVTRTLELFAQHGVFQK